MAKRRALKQDELGIDYFFLYPFGHFGFVPDTFLVVLPLMQVIVDFLLCIGGVDSIGAGEGLALGLTLGIVDGVGADSFC